MWTSIGDALRKEEPIEAAEVPLEGDPDGLLDADLMRKRVIGPQLPVRLQRRLEVFAGKEGPKLQSFLDYLSISLLWLVLHQGLNVHSQSPGSALVACPIHAWPTLGFLMFLLVFRISMVVLSGTGTGLPLSIVLSRDVIFILSGVFLSAAVVTVDFDNNQSSDFCTTQTNPVASLASLYGDVNGLVTLLSTCLTLYARPFSCGDRRLSGASSVLLWVILALAIQVVLLDLVVVPWLSSALQQVDPATFTSLDAWWSGKA